MARDPRSAVPPRNGRPPRTTEGLHDRRRLATRRPTGPLPRPGGPTAPRPCTTNLTNSRATVLESLVPIREYSRDVRFVLAAVHGPQRSGTVSCVRSHGSVSPCRGEQVQGAPYRRRNRGRPRYGVCEIRPSSCASPLGPQFPTVAPIAYANIVFGRIPPPILSFSRTVFRTVFLVLFLFKSRIPSWLPPGFSPCSCSGFS
jgi:hypothetical protein